MNSDLFNIIFGMKVRQARLEAGLSLSEFAARCELSPSYVTEIERGRKYPKADKIFKMAGVLGKDYDELVSIKLAPALSHLETLLSSPLLRQFPFSEFGVEIGDLVQLFTRAPVQASALVHAALEIGRQYDMKEEHFLWAALRSYQELHDNYFPELEEAALSFRTDFHLEETFPIELARLKEILQSDFRYHIDETRLSRDPLLSAYRSVSISGPRPTLLINTVLQPRQIKFLLLRELGYLYLNLKERSATSAPDQVDSFQQVLNDFKAAYFAGAVLMPRTQILGDLQQFFHLHTWSPYRLLNMLDQYEVTPEMLLYRFSELIPQFFGIKIHFLRFHSYVRGFQLVKQLNMNQLILPGRFGMNEHYCRRWLAVRLLQELQREEAAAQPDTHPLVGVQISEFLDSQDRFLSFGFARPLSLQPGVASSVIVGFRVQDGLEQVIHFAHDPAVPTVTVHQTCERCPLTREQCTVRAAEPTIWQTEQQKAARQAALHRLKAELQP